MLSILLSGLRPIDILLLITGLYILAYCSYILSYIALAALFVSTFRYASFPTLDPGFTPLPPQPQRQLPPKEPPRDTWSNK